MSDLVGRLVKMRLPEDYVDEDEEEMHWVGKVSLFIPKSARLPDRLEVDFKASRDHERARTYKAEYVMHFLVR